MKTIRNTFILAILSLFASVNIFADDVTAFSDDFNRSAVSPGGSPSMTYTISGAAPVLIDLTTNPTNSLRVTAGNQGDGIVYVGGNLSLYNAPFNTILKNNTADSIVWTVNARHNYNGNLSGFNPNANQRGMGIVLAATSSDITLADGYAIVNGENPQSPRYRLVKFTGGLDATDNLESLLNGQSLSSSRDFVSLKVVYIPSTNTWKFYDRKDGNGSGTPLGSWLEPTTNTGYILAGEIVDNTYTSTVMSSFGCLVKYGGTTTFNVWFDNFKTVLHGVQASASSEARLSSLKVSTDNGTNYNSLIMFSPDTETYQYYLLKGQALPLVSAEKMDAKAQNPVIEQATAENSNTATITVTAEDGTEKEYQVEFIATDNIFMNGLTGVAAQTPAGWGANNIYFASSTVDGNNKYEGLLYARCLSASTVASITLPATNSVGTFKFYAKKVDAGVVGSIKVNVKVGDGEYVTVKDFGDISNLAYQEFSVDINRKSTQEDILVRIAIEKNGGDNPSTGYYFDDFSYTESSTSTSIPSNLVEKTTFNIYEVQGGFVIEANNAQLSVFNVDGKLICKENVSGLKEITLNSKGVYILGISSEGITTYKKLIVK